ncbi:MAG: hypothetical protein FWC43_09845 [Planctomycetaceae bacterium]|nr:hypothetical protein [Planctomycetaceae bacterium]
MVEKEEASNIMDAISRIMAIGLQVKDQFDFGYTEVIVQNPQKQHARFIDLYRLIR